MEGIVNPVVSKTWMVIWFDLLAGRDVGSKGVVVFDFAILVASLVLDFFFLCLFNEPVISYVIYNLCMRYNAIHFMSVCSGFRFFLQNPISTQSCSLENMKIKLFR